MTDIAKHFEANEKPTWRLRDHFRIRMYSVVIEFCCLFSVWQLRKSVKAAKNG